MAVRHPDIYGRALHGRRADDWATDDLRQPATSSVCSFDSTRTERTASTCSAGRNSSACSSTATGTTWSATAAVAHGEPIPSTRGLAGAGHQAVPGQLVALNVVLDGGVGTGKTHLAIALGMACCQHDYRVRFLTAAELTTLLVEAQQQGRLARKLDHLARFDVVILDELGYVPFDKAGADLLFGFISRRYERGSLVVTTNLPFARWSEVFLDVTAAAAVIDRIVHHATVLTTNGDSYRLKAAQRNQTAHARQKKTR